MIFLGIFGEQKNALLFGLTAIFSISCAHISLPEHFYFDSKSEFVKKFAGWKVIDYRNYDRGKIGHLDYIAPPGSGSGKAWSELLTKEIIIGQKLVVAAYVDDSTLYYKTKCPGTVHEVINSNERTIYYVNKYPACNGANQQTEVTRISKGNAALYRVSYTVNGRDMPSTEIQEWISLFQTGFVAIGEAHDKVL